jgi:hypothetical protein
MMDAHLVTCFTCSIQVKDEKVKALMELAKLKEAYLLKW